MAAKVQIHENSRVFVPQDSHFSYVLSITLPQPTIRIKIPRVLAKSMQRRNQARCGNDAENVAVIDKKKSFRKKVASMVSTVFGVSKKSPEAGSNGNDEEAMMRITKMIESLDVGSEEIAAKSFEDKKEMVQAATVEPPTLTEAGNERKERPKSRRTYPSRRLGNDSSAVCEDIKVGNGTVGTKAGNGSNVLTRSRTVNGQQRKPKVAWSMTRLSEMMAGKRKKEVWKKRILMGGKCKPLNYSGEVF